MKEKYIIPEVKNHMQSWGFGTGAYEFKLARGLSVPFLALERHQADALECVSRGFFAWKIADLGQRNPFDMFVLDRTPAFVVVVFWVPRKIKRVVFMLIDTWVNESEVSARRSLTMERAMELGKWFDL